MGGGQKNTGKHRPKRPDLRANAKKRQVERTKAYEAKEGVTYATKRAEKKRKLEAGEDVKKERKFDNQGMKVKRFTDDQKLIRALQKKLRQIEELEQKQTGGIELDEQQLAKLASKDDVLLELEHTRNPPAASQEQDSEDSEDDDEDDDDEEDED